MNDVTTGPPKRHRRGTWGFTIPKGELLQHLAQGRSRAEIARRYALDPSRITRAVQALTREELATAMLRAMSARTPQRALVHPEVALEPVDAAELLLRSVGGLQRILRVCEAYIARHEQTLSAKRHRGALAVYFEAVRTLAKAVHELVATQAKLSEWVGMEELRSMVVNTFDELAQIEGPVQPADAKNLFLAKFQAKVTLLRAGRRAVGPVPDAATGASGSDADGHG